MQNRTLIMLHSVTIINSYCAVNAPYPASRDPFNLPRVRDRSLFIRGEGRRVKMGEKFRNSFPSTAGTNQIA